MRYNDARKPLPEYGLESDSCSTTHGIVRENQRSGKPNSGGIVAEISKVNDTLTRAEAREFWSLANLGRC
jgi:hypothetical protein